MGAKLPPITCQGYEKHEFSRGQATGYYDRLSRWRSPQDELIETPPQEVQSDMLDLMSEAKDNSRDLYTEIQIKKEERKEMLRRQRVTKRKAR
jgi:hypothetical protein